MHGAAPPGATFPIHEPHTGPLSLAILQPPMDLDEPDNPYANMPPSNDPTAVQPLAPSVEKAYYRKCIELKRRLNEVETANDEAKIRRVRLDRGIMKMRLERAFLLDELRKRMEYNVDGSEGSGDEGLTTPPPDRPHRDKRRRTDPAQPAANAPSAATAAVATQATQPPIYALQPPVQRLSSQPEAGHVPVVPAPGGVNLPSNAIDEDGRPIYMAPHDLAAVQQQRAAGTHTNRVIHGSAPRPPSGLPGTVNGLSIDGADDRERDAPINRDSGAVGEALSAGPAIREDSNGERRIVSSVSGQDANADGQKMESAGGGGFTAVNQG